MTQQNICLSILNQSKSWPVSRCEFRSMEDFTAVYAIFSDKQICRLRGNTNIIYIGSTKRLGGKSDRARLYAYNYPSGSHARLIKSRCQELINDGHQLTLRWKQLEHLSEARKLEECLLKQHFNDHLEYPPFNGKAK